MMGGVVDATAQSARLEKARAALAAVQTRVGTSKECWDAPTLPLASALSDALPAGLRRGQVVAVQGSTSLVLALVAEASREGSWTAMIGMPNVGVVAAARRGIELSRLALVPHPGSQAPAVAGACVDGMDVVVLGPRLALADSDRRRLAARARERGAVIVSAGPWDGANVGLTVLRSTWSGLGAGDGRLRARDLIVEVTSRAGGPARRIALTLEADVMLRTRQSVGQASLEGAA
jgi:hypothetical protein